MPSRASSMFGCESEPVSLPSGPEGARPSTQAVPAWGSGNTNRKFRKSVLKALLRLNAS